MTMEIFIGNTGAILALMTLLWIVSVIKRDASIVDPWWSILFLVIACNSVYRTGQTPGKIFLLFIVCVWALRLWLHLTLRSRGKTEDPRYAEFRRRFGPDRYWWVSFFQVFLLQGALALIISAPLQIAAAAPLPDFLSLWDYAGATFFVVGFLIETIADAQLQSFRGNPEKKGGVLDTGLWRYSRHPNYFGEALLWWGFWLCTIDQPYGVWTVFAPALMTFLLMRVSGVTMLDEHLAKTKPGFSEYMKRTSSFIPMPPKSDSTRG